MRRLFNFCKLLTIRYLTVEPAGVEPASEQVTNLLSTCVFLYWFSSCDRERTPYRNLSFLISLTRQNFVQAIPNSIAPHKQKVSDKLSERRLVPPIIGRIKREFT